MIIQEAWSRKHRPLYRFGPCLQVFDPEKASCWPCQVKVSHQLTRRQSPLVSMVEFVIIQNVTAFFWFSSRQPTLFRYLVVSLVYCVPSSTMSLPHISPSATLAPKHSGKHDNVPAGSFWMSESQDYWDKRRRNKLSARRGVVMVALLAAAIIFLSVVAILRRQPEAAE